MRLSGTVRTCASNRPSHKMRWVKALAAAGLQPLIQVLAILEVEQAPATERRLIAQLQQEEGCRLTNATAGGEGTAGLRLSPEHRAKLVAANRSRTFSQDTLAAMRARMTDEHKARLAQSLQSEKVRSKMSASHLGHKHSAETRIKMSHRRSEV